jgi:hypothetical protein
VEFTCAWERLHGVKLDQLPWDQLERLVVDRGRPKGVLDLRAALGSVPRRQAA